MDFVTWIIASIVAVCLLYVWLHDSRPKGFPPGPRGLPIFGRIPFLSKARHLSLTDLGKQYGGMYSLKMGQRYYIILNDWKSMKAALVNQSDVFSGRPEVYALEEVLKRENIIFSDGPLWKAKRRFALKHLRNIGIGTSSMEDIIVEEVRNVLGILKSHDNQQLEMSELFYMPMMNVVWGIIGGRKFDYQDKQIKSFSSILKNVFDAIKQTNLVNAMPWLKYIPGDLGGLHKLSTNHSKVVLFLEEEIEKHIATYNDSQPPRDFIDVYLAEIFKNKEMESENSWKKRRHLVGTLFDFFIAGVETTAYTMVWSLMYMALWPEIQRKVQEELDSVIGRHRMPNYSDRYLLPYTEATLMEVHRYTSVVPLSIPHTPIITTNLLGYTIPKGATCIQNIWAVHHDKEYWGDPENFRPERFLDDERKVQKPEYLIPFSAGGRMCLGEPIARMELVLFFTCLLHQYRFSCVSGEKRPTLDPVLSITLRPKPFHLMVKQR